MHINELIIIDIDMLINGHHGCIDGDYSDVGLKESINDQFYLNGKDLKLQGTNVFYAFNKN